MGRINILDDESANMIAAGEVVDRPSSALKELIENSLDAGARSISVYLRNGGNSRIRVSDNGCGILREDLPKALLRHATSKIRTGYDIDGVKTLGFRGEALAAASAVSRMEIITKTAEENMGSRLTANETGVELYEAGCPDGTTVTIDDLFFNVPARRKFMKKDSSEASSCCAVCEKLALSHPEASITLYSDDVRKFRTPGDNKLYSAIYAIYGAEVARSFTEVSYTLDGVTVTGYISRQDSPRGTRTMQTFFVNSRYVKSRTAQAALEEAHRSYIPSGKFPAAVLNIALDAAFVDVNVHPAKTEVKFSDEKSVFSAVYYAVKNALSPAPNANTSVKTEPNNPQIAPKSTESRPPVSSNGHAPYAQARYDSTKSKPVSSAGKSEIPGYEVFSARSADSELPETARRRTNELVLNSPTNEETEAFTAKTASEADNPPIQEALAPIPEITVLGEAYHTYIFAQLNDKILIIDKHAAHERILYEKLRTGRTAEAQTLLFPVTITLSPSEAATLIENADYLNQFGFTVEEFGPATVAVREVPASLKNTDGLSQLLETFAKELSENTALPFEDKVDKALYTVACKAAIKAGDITNERNDEYIVETILKLGLTCCPHGRPFVKEISKRELEKYFDR